MVRHQGDSPIRPPLRHAELAEEEEGWELGPCLHDGCPGISHLVTLYSLRILAFVQGSKGRRPFEKSLSSPLGRD